MATSLCGDFSMSARAADVGRPIGVPLQGFADGIDVHKREVAVPASPQLMLTDQVPHAIFADVEHLRSARHTHGQAFDWRR